MANTNARIPIDGNDDAARLLKAYEKFIPYRLAEFLGKKNIADIKLGDQIEKIFTVQFLDIRDFTSLSEALSPKETFDFINSFLNQMCSIIDDNKGIINKFIGDNIMAVFPKDSDLALNCSLSMLNQLEIFNKTQINKGLKPVNIGIGLNTGFCMLGILGNSKRREFAVIGDVVNLAARIESLTKTYGVPLLVSENTINSLQNISNYSMRFIDRVLVRGKKIPQTIYEIFDTDSLGVNKLKRETKFIFEEALAHYHYRNIDVAQKLLEKCIQINPADNPAKVYLNRCKNFIKAGSHKGAKELEEDITWSSYFEIGHKEIDKQHHELLSNSIKLFKSIDKNRSNSEIANIISFIENYTNKHFLTEERFLSEINYPYLNNQIIQHQNFVKSFELIRREIETGTASKTYIKFRIQVLLVDWIINHILKEDKHYSNFYKNIRKNHKPEV